jgi:hypothetical protein
MAETEPDHHRSSVSGSPTRYAATLIMALLASAPAFSSALNDRLSLPGALVRFLLAFAIFWVMGALFSFVTRVPGSAGADR